MPQTRQTAKTIESQPFLLLRRVREVMAQQATVQERLDRMVSVIAAELGADVCSIYLLRAGDVLELYATEGLNPSAIHLTRLNIGEGLVGEIAAIAAPLNLSDANKHPKFVYRPETGEEKYRAFVGVPILTGGNVVGVLVVQSREEKTFFPEDVEVLQTIAMVLAELHTSGQLVRLGELFRGGSDSLLSEHLTGLSLSPGLVRAPALIHQPQIEIRSFVADDPDHEAERLENAIAAVQKSVENLVSEEDMSDGEPQREIMETYLMFTQDKGWLRQLGDAIGSGLTAEAAVKKVQDQLHARLSEMSSQYIRDKIQDLEDLSTQLLQHLTTEEEQSTAAELPPRFILVAKSLGPAEFMRYSRKRIKALVLEEGSLTGHIAVIARAMDIPVVGRVDNALKLIHNGDPVIVDGDNGDVYVRPYDDVVRAISERLKLKRRHEAAYEKIRNLPAESLDGKRISLNMNIVLHIDSRHLQEEGVDGIGLYRTELPYMISRTMPDIDAQVKVYSRVLRQAGGKRVVFRTFDIGSDKQLPYFPIEEEENPAMGWRATRIAIDRPAIIRRQFRALITATAGCELSIMFPFIAHVSELDTALSLFHREWENRKAEGAEMPSSLRVGAMIEIPSLLWQLPELFKRVDFVSVGSNDLLQFLFACDRGSQKLTGRYDELSPLVLKLIRDIVRQCDDAGVELGFCGDMARKPLEAMALVAAGVRNLSLAPSAIGPVKSMIRSVNIDEIGTYLDSVIDYPDSSIRTRLAEFARDHNVAI